MRRTVNITIASVLALLATTAARGRTYVVNGPVATATDQNPGTDEKPLKTIQAAARQAGPGDTVLVHAGIYRERITPLRGGTDKQPVIYQAAPGETVVVKGSDVRTNWQSYGEQAGVYSADLAGRIPGQLNPYLTTISIAPTDKSVAARPAAHPDQLAKTLGQLFWDGSPMIQVTSVTNVLESANTWTVTADGRQILAHFTGSPRELATHRIEVTVRDRLFCPERRGLGYIHIRGFIFEHCSNQGPFPQAGAVTPRSGHDWVIEDNTIRFAMTVGLDVGSETWMPEKLKDTVPEDRVRMDGGHHLVQGNTITDNGLCGIEGWNHHGVIIRDNIIERNNRLDFSMRDAEWEEWAGIKLHGGAAVIEGNLIRDNEAFGIWLDNGYEGSRISRNVIVNNRMAGVFLELGFGAALIDNNVIAYTRPRGNYFAGMGIYSHDASDITIAHNLVLGNADGGIVMRTTSDRKFKQDKLVQTSNEKIFNNILWENSQAAINLPYPNDRGTNNVSDYNLIFGAHEYWQGQSEPWQALFAVNKFKGTVPMEVIVKKLREALTRGKVPEDDWPNLKHWPKNPVLSLPEWRLFMGQDQHSLESPAALDVLVRPQALTATIKASPAVAKMDCPVVPGVDRDFFGHPIRAGHVLPGPFQNLTETATEFVLFPVPDESPK